MKEGIETTAAFRFCTDAPLAEKLIITTASFLKVHDQETADKVLRAAETGEFLAIEIKVK